MGKRRDYGSGSVYQRADGKWVGSFEAGWTERGTRRRLTVIRDTEPRAKVALRDRIREFEDAGESSANPRTTLKQWADTWLPIAERKLRPNSYNTTASAVRRWIIPTIGHKRLTQLAPGDIRAVLTAQREVGGATSSLRRTHSALMQLLKGARAEGHLVPPRTLEVPAPPPGASDRQDMSVAEAVAVLGQAAELPHGSRYVAALLQGMRQGECLGLTWEQINLEAGHLVLSWQLQPLPYRVPRDRSSGFRVPDGYESRQVRGRWHLVRPKSDSGWRVIPLVPWMTSALESWREQAPYSPMGLVWPIEVGDPPKRDDAEWYGLQEAAGVHHPSRTVERDGKAAPAPYTIHEARHTTATLLLEAGVDPAVIQAILGHASIVTTRGYQHVRIGPAKAALEAVAERLGMGQG